MGGKKYSVILMRDDDHVRRYRMSSIWFRFAIYSFIFLILVSAGGIYLGLKYWNKYLDVSATNQALQEEIQTQDVELERLRNMERMVMEHQTLPDNATAEDNATGVNATAAVRATEQANATPTETVATKANATPEANATPTAAVSPYEHVTPVELMQGLDKGETAINELNLKETGDGYAIHFLIRNEKDRGVLSGMVSLALVDQEGAIRPIDAPKEALDFTIQRFKTINVTFKTPDGLEKDKTYGLLVKVTNKAGELVFSKVYHLPDILSS
ncbi:hypothetical protein [Oceanidesulfovibrio marinus]|uniref:Uncharacterized protein n=1 Tax=Oceanidesulfovibrio marinus TaxID=370038 RepID=A0A6P1ZKS8_9BACT|nr:hypothetical protein [Oceanidesulfovibrio marinus]TVM35694.1 hypothetical protein DQK91_03240 [Oceanidesulfovibrio marinus]